MNTPQLTRSLAALAAAALFALPAAAQNAGKEAAKEYTPQVGQEGKDVIWVPTPQALVERMLDMAKLTPKDIHYDLGSGDGRTVITAAKRGAQAYGVEYNPDMVKLSERAAAREGVSEKAKFINGDIFQTDFTQATVITLYLLPALNMKLRPQLLAMRPGMTDYAAILFRDESAMLDAERDPVEVYRTVIMPMKYACYERYSREVGFANDLRIILATVLMLVSKRAPRWFGIDSEPLAVSARLSSHSAAETRERRATGSHMTA